MASTTLPDLPTASVLAASDVLLVRVDGEASDRNVAASTLLAYVDANASFASGAQGALADSAVQPSDIANMVESTDVDQIVVLTQSEYDGLTPVATTLYIIEG